MYKNFSAVEKKTSKDFTDKSLTIWLEQYIHILFPENAIDYWSTGDDALDREPKELSTYNGTTGLHHSACYARNGSSEGMIIHVLLMNQDGTYQTVATAKSFCNPDMNWEITRAISEVLESLLQWEEIPMLNAIYENLPKDSRYKNEISIKSDEEIILKHDESSLTIYLTGSVDNELMLYDFKGEENSKFKVEPILNDYKRILKTNNIKFSEIAA